MPLNFPDRQNCPSWALRSERGATLIVVLVMLVVLGLAAGMAGTAWRTIMQQVREEELLFRGDQYRRAIESYSKFAHGNAQPQTQQTAGSSPGRVGAAPGGANYPAKLEDLLRDPRFPGVRRHIRKLYKDPFTGEDFVLIQDPGGRIKGVRSASEEEPFKKDNFAPEYENFKDVENYQKWEFVFEPGKKGSTNTTGGTQIQGLDDLRDAQGNPQSSSSSSSSDWSQSSSSSSGSSGRSQSTSSSRRPSGFGSSNPFR